MCKGLHPTVQAPPALDATTTTPPSLIRKSSSWPYAQRQMLDQVAAPSLHQLLQKRHLPTESDHNTDFELNKLRHTMTMTTVRLLSTDDSTKVRTDTMTFVELRVAAMQAHSSRATDQQLALSLCLDELRDNVEPWHRLTFCVRQEMKRVTVTSSAARRKGKVCCSADGYCKTTAFMCIHDLHNGQSTQKKEDNLPRNTRPETQVEPAGCL